MCGIIGILGRDHVSNRLISALKRMEYRGYDSAGIATLVDGSIERRRAAGKLSALEEMLANAPLIGTSGIGHTRWATHGAPTTQNAHPHMTERVALVHNGIIENYAALRDELLMNGTKLEGQSDTEIITHVMDQKLASGVAPVEAFHALLSMLDGAFALAVLVRGEDDLLLVAKHGSPLVIGLADDEIFAGSDAIAVGEFTNQVIYLEDGDSAVLSRSSYEIFDAGGKAVERDITITHTQPGMVGKGNHRHFMHKEVFEQPTVVAQTLSRYIDFSTGALDLPDLDLDLANFDKITLVACGTAYYAGCVAQYWFEQIAHTVASVDIASEFRYRKPVLKQGELSIFISQSGETADTLAALKLAKELGQKTLAIVNVTESSIAREADMVLPIYAGVEIGVASTKAFTCQLAALATLVLKMAASKKVISDDALKTAINDLEQLPAKMASVLNNHEHLREIAQDLAGARDTLFVGRGIHYPIALEGALKLKELSYIHAEGYAAGELKHGPIALIDENVPVIALAPSHELYEKTVSNLQEIEARKGRTIIISDQTNGEKGKNLIEMPKASHMTSPILYALPVQLLAYYTAVAKGTDVDQPRNLAKSVTVE